MSFAVARGPYVYQRERRSSTSKRSEEMSGAIVHIEIPGGADTAQARAFWRALFGWQFEEVPIPSIEYSLARINDDQGVAVSSIEPDKRGILRELDIADDDVVV